MKIKPTIILLVLFLLSIQLSAQSYVRDAHGNSYPVMKLQNGNMWITQNMSYPTKWSWCYKGAKECKDEGRLYRLEYAQEACKTLGPGWKVPTIGDWENLREQVMKEENVPIPTSLSERNLLAYKILFGPSKFNATLEGFIKTSIHFLNRNPDWVPSPTDGSTSWGRGGYGQYLTTSQKWVYSFRKFDKRMVRWELKSSINASSLRCMKR